MDIEMLPPTAKDISFGSAFANGGTANGGTATGGNGSGSQAASSGKPQQELPALTHQYAEQYVYAYPAAPAYGGPPKPPPAYRYGYGYGGGGSGGPVKSNDDGESKTRQKPVTNMFVTETKSTSLLFACVTDPGCDCYFETHT
ncbi:hypothetical protein TRIUR3_31841 [Triticum urartu]|uniref:Uncharacterized protein n=2 Tax=Triticum TaxID=4564 RepID=A0A9R1BKJ5_TRITD|nr:hypothetical protein TRIUR3_31841 [Triticum urartu]VAI71580.1 unnamed protein product [Triticum turgidum subsp. durum]